MQDFKLCTLKNEGIILGQNGYHFFSNWEAVSIQNDNIMIDYKLSARGFNITPQGYRKNLSNLVEHMIVLLNMDYHSSIRYMKGCIEEYLQLEGYSCKVVYKIFDRFFRINKKLHPYLAMKSGELMIEELIVQFNNKYWNRDSLDIDITISLFEKYLQELKKVIYPLLRIILREENTCEWYWENCRLIRYRNLFSCRSISELKSVSLLETMENTLEFLEIAIEYIKEYKDELLYLSIDQIMYQCINSIFWEIKMTRFDRNKFERLLSRKYHEIIQVDNMFMKIRADIIKLHNEKERRVGRDGERVEKDEKRIKKLETNLKMERDKRIYRIDSFEQLVLLILKENIRHLKEDNKWVLKNCENCGRFFMAVPSNRIYCDNKSPQDPDKTCRNIGANIKHDNKANEFEKTYRKLKKRAYQKRNRAPDKNYQKKIWDKIENWEKEKNIIEERLKNNELTEKEAVEELQQKYDSIINGKKDLTTTD